MHLLAAAWQKTDIISKCTPFTDNQTKPNFQTKKLFSLVRTVVRDNIKYTGQSPLKQHHITLKIYGMHCIPSKVM